MKKALKLLAIGNSFSVDTLEYLPKVASDLGYTEICIGNLYIGGCSLNRHFKNLSEDAPAYKYYLNKGEGWSEEDGYSISGALSLCDWDYVSIQHGTGDKSRYTSPESYLHLSDLISYVRGRVKKETKVIFNMAWVGEPYFNHHELYSYGNDQLLMYEKLTDITRDLVLKTAGVDIVSPTGTAVQNARTSIFRNNLSRDGYHLSFGIGRYISALTYFKAITGEEIAEISWMPEGVTEEEKKLAVESANNAVSTPFEVTVSKFC